jgi:phospholipid transport system substrate-binding protein
MHHLAAPAILAVVLFALLLVPAPSAAGTSRDTAPTDVVRRHFESVLALLKSATFRNLPAEERLGALRRVSDRTFGWDEMARRALGASWAGRIADERRSFTDGFARLMERFYLGRLEEAHVGGVSEVPIRYLGETIALRATIVRTRLVHRRDLPVNFWMVHGDYRWQVVDVEVDGVSLVDNYRAQFSRVIARDGYPALLDRIADRLDPPGVERDAAASP